MSTLQKIFIRSVLIVLFVTFPLWAIAIFARFHPAKSSVISPVPDGQIYITPTVEPTPIECPRGIYPKITIHDDWQTFDVQCIPQGKPDNVVRGKASYYSRAGCLGCSKDMIMANGEPLDDSKLTVAYNDAPINSYVTVTNVGQNKSVRAKVTDTGGFKRHGKIVDLTMATRDAIGCGPVCDVEVKHE